MSEICQKLEYILGSKAFPGDLDFTPIEYEGDNAPFAYQSGNLAVPIVHLQNLYISSRRGSKVSLLINPSDLSSWNKRRRMVISGDIRSEDEYLFTSFLLSKHAGKPAIWGMRKWLVQRIGPINYEVEIFVCNRAADRYPNNYHAWAYRKSIFATLVLDVKKEEQAADYTSRLIDKELLQVESFVSTI